MADLKNIDEKQLLETVEKAARNARDTIDCAAAEAMRAVGEAARALVALPRNTGDLIAGADAVYVAEANLGATHEASFHYNTPPTNNFTLGTDFMRKRPGRYRLICAFIRLPDDSKPEET